MNALSENRTGEHRVFIVDDHAVLREGLSELINRERDFSVCGMAGSVSEALKAIPECSPDIVIVDLTLEDGSGLRLIENLAYSSPDLPVLVLSMHDENIYAERCLKAGARGYIMKQAQSQKMMSALRKVMDGKIYVNEDLGSALLDRFTAKRTENAASKFENLSNRELEVYQLVGRGLKNREISDKLNLSVKTVDNYMEHIKKKLGLRNSHEVILHAARNHASI